MDISAWLHDLGLGHYEQMFRDHGVDPEVLPHLTADDLRDMGVTAIGHRRKLLQAIGMLRRTLDDPPEVPTSPHAEAPARSPEPTAERRQLTVMFVDLVGSTALAHRLDPEDMREVIRAYQYACAGAIARFEGHVAKYMGDGVLAYFGYPHAHEDEAGRAVRAGLTLVEDVGRLAVRSGVSPLQVRVGIATGLVVVGDLIGIGSAQEQSVAGETPNLAARLQALAPPGGVVIAPSTQHLVGSEFKLEDLGVQQLKGFAEPVRIARVLGERAVESRFEARATGPMALIGREEEVGLLLRRWEQVRDGEGQVVLLSGEPGIGKSRITRTLYERIEADPHIRLRHQCSPYFANSAFHPTIEHLERAADFQREDPPSVKLDKLEALLAQGTAKVTEAASLVAALLSIPTDERYPPLVDNPQKQKERTIEVLIEQVIGVSRKQSVLIVFEDLHWADPSTLEMLDQIIVRIIAERVLLLLTFRPEFTRLWRGQPHVTPISLNRMARRQSAALVEKVTDGKALPAEVLEQIVAKTDGVPLFVEELTKAVLEAGFLVEEADRYVLSGPLPPLAIPSTLKDSLMARLDRLAPVKEVAQIGAAIGREFSYELLAAVSSLRDSALQDALAQLVNAELVFRKGTPPEAVYTFKHALVRDTAYENLLKSRRQELHARLARTLEERFPETAVSEPELLAYHCTQAGYAEKAVDYWYKAGQLALARSAMPEAVAQLTQGLAALKGLPDGIERERRELSLQMTLGGALIATKGYAATETGAAFARARELCQRVGDAATTFRVLYGEWAYLTVRGEITRGRKVTEEFLCLAQQQARSDVLVIGHRAVGVNSLLLGQLRAARTHLEQSLALYDSSEHRSLNALYAFDPRAIVLSWLSLLLFLLGYADQAVLRVREALAAARDLAHPATHAYALNHAILLHQLLRDRPAVEEFSTALISLTSDHGFPFWLAAATIQRGWLTTSLGRPKVGADQMRDGLAAYRATGSEHMVPYYLALGAEAHAASGRVDEGLGLVEEALATVGRNGECWFEAELYRLRGELLLALPEADRPQAEACFRQALAAARERGAKMWELRAAASFARLWRDRGRRAEARDLLAPVYGWFTEGFDSSDLQEAKALLDELG